MTRPAAYPSAPSLWRGLFLSETLTIARAGFNMPLLLERRVMAKIEGWPPQDWTPAPKFSDGDNFYISVFGYALHASRDVRLLNLTLELFSTRGEDVAQWLGVTRQRVNQWSTGREPMPLARQKQFLEVMQKHVKWVRGLIFNSNSWTLRDDMKGMEGYKEERLPEFIDVKTSKVIIKLFEELLVDEARRLEGKEST